MDTFRNLHIERDKPGVMTVVFDVPGRSINVLDEGLLRDLAAVVMSIENDRTVNLVVFRSGKESGFLAGADVKRLQEIASRDEAEMVLSAGQELFGRIARLPMLTVAVIHGPCLGGGLELALACGFRVARDDGTTRLGLPETQLGVIPGWGGTQRLPRLVGLEAALRMILEGQRLPTARALTLGLVDMIAAPERFEQAVEAFLTDRLAGKPVRRRKRPLLARLRDDSWPGRRLVFHVARKKMGRRAQHYPALGAAMHAIETGFAQGLARGLAVEREEFCRALFTPACRNLLEIFFQRERARKPATWSGSSEVAAQEVKMLAVIGAGVMGSGIAQLAAYQGLSVVLKDIRRDIVDQGLARVASLMHDAVRGGSLTADEAKRRSEAVTGAADFEAVARADVAVEAVVERLDVKQQVLRELDARLPRESLITSNTSALPIGELASATSRPAQVAGLHFFNPVHRMMLVEVVRSDATSDQTVATLVELVCKLGKVPIVVAEAPGFLVNRILFPYLDEAVRLVCEGAAVYEVDREAERFGMFMGPLELLDQVGIDVAADVARTLESHGAGDSPTPRYFQKLIEQGRLGKKSGAGFYSYRKGRKHDVAAATEKHEGTPRLPPPVPFASGELVGGIAQRLALAIVNASAQCLADQIVREPWIVDLAMVLGTGFAPFRGGPLRLADAWGIDRVVAALDQLVEICGPRFTASALFRDMQRQGTTFHNGTPAGLHAEPATTTA